MPQGFFVADDAQEAGGARPEGAASPLPCLSSHNSIGTEHKQNVLTGVHKRSAHVLYAEVKQLAEDYGLACLGFLTLTFPRVLRSLENANRIFNSALTNLIRPRYECGIIDLERHLSGGIHFHLVVATKNDMRSGFDFNRYDEILREIKNGSRKAFRAPEVGANAFLTAEWAFLRERLPRYGFGRSEFLPVRSNAEGIARYVGKYISKHIGNRKPEDKGARLVRYFGYRPGQRVAGPAFHWHNDNSWLWRMKLKQWATRKGFKDTDEIKALWGPRWCFLLQNEILAEKLDNVVYPSLAAIGIAQNQEDKMLIARYKAGCVVEDRVCDKTYILGNRKYERQPVAKS